MLIYGLRRCVGCRVDPGSETVELSYVNTGSKNVEVSYIDSVSETAEVSWMPFIF